MLCQIEFRNNMVAIKNVCKLWCDFSTLQQYYSVANMVRWKKEITLDNNKFLLFLL